MFKSKASHHLLSEGKHSLQGDKHKKLFRAIIKVEMFTQFMHRAEIPKNIGILYAVCYIYSFRGNVFFLFIALRLMQNPKGDDAAG